ncbi:hypothetical protein T5B8_15565 [Salinisphaera sp. T5B8]|uniref:hypothetical protein n=1 Tax=Salinisphaera sp. T5B8 TaxID=1304154 RepID=UPI0033420D51
MSVARFFPTIIKTLIAVLVVFTLNVLRILLQAFHAGAAGLSLANVDAVFVIALQDTVMLIIYLVPLLLLAYIIWANRSRKPRDS